MVIQKNENWQLFNESKCTQCGDCFHLCPEMKLPVDIAKKEIKALIQYEKSEYVLYHCTTCFSCNLICPNDCKPYELILQNWNKRYWQRGAPQIYRFVCPTLDKNIWQMLMALMQKDEKERIKKWMTQKPTDTIFLVGNYTHLLSFIIDDSKLLKYFTPVDLIDHWESGAYLFQGGYLDVVKQIGANCKNFFDNNGVKNIVTMLDAVEYMMNVAHPTETGVKFNQNIISMNKWLLDKLNDGTIKFEKQLDMKVTVHDNCYSKANGELYWNTAREIIKRTGCKIIEMEHIKENALCCGFGKGASSKKNFSIPFNILACTQIKFKEAEKTDADALVTYCGGCLYLLWAAKVLFNSKLKVFHSIELVRLALGEDVDIEQKEHIERAWDVITIITYHLLLSLFKRRFYIDKLTFEESPFKEKKFLFLRFMRKMLSLKFMRAIYRKMFLIMLKTFKTKRTWEES